MHAPDDELESNRAADIVNDYLMKQLYADPRNHMKTEDYVETVLGKKNANSINSMTAKTADRIMQTLADGTKQLGVIKKVNEKITGKSKEKIEEAEIDAERKIEEAKRKIEESERELKKIEKASKKN